MLSFAHEYFALLETQADEQQTKGSCSESSKSSNTENEGKKPAKRLEYLGIPKSHVNYCELLILKVYQLSIQCSKSVNSLSN